MNQDLSRDINQSRVDEFLAKYGIDHGSAEILFKDGSALPTILQHMYFEAMEELRECIIKEDGERIQGQTQILWTLLNIPKELEELKELDI